MNNTVYLIVYCNCSDGGSFGKSVQAFSTAEQRNYVFDTECGKTPHLTGYEKIDVKVDGPKIEVAV